jgi:CheY-like chemotaxis protein
VPKILVADDNTNIQKMVALAFQERGVDVIAVGNGEAAVRRLPDLQPDLVLADVFMPVRNGYEVCEFVKKDERFSHIPVILLVGAFDPLDEKEARRVGADGVLKKPFVPPDPLIAMVMSALEKNPKVAAALAKAREVIAEPPPPLMPALEIPAKAEPKPLPEFPEPTPEEAAAIYGFGKGVRTLDDEPEESAGLKKAAPKKGEDEEEDFDGAATASDWRRSAADFEVPEEAGGRLAFADNEEFSPITFPSERDVPPRHIRVEDPAEEIEPVVMEEDSAPAPAPAQALAPVAKEEEEKVTVASSSYTEETSIEAQSKPAAAPEPERVTSHASSPAYSLPNDQTELEPAEAPPVEVEAKQESGFLSKAAHWMDMMAPSPSEGSSGGWMSNLLGRHKEPEAAQPAPVASAPLAVIERPVEALTESNATELKSKFEAKTEPVAQAQAETKVEAKIEEPSQPAISHQEIPAEQEPQSTSGQQSESTLYEPGAPPASEPWFAPPAKRHEAGFNASSESASTSHSAAKPPSPSSDEFEREPDNLEPSLRDPMLDESPAVHVKAEPLLVDDVVSGPSKYGKRSETTSPLHSFFVPPPDEPAVEDHAASDSSARSEFPSFEPVPVEPVTNGFDERIPTVPPPNREALAAIPFLTPPVLAPQEIRSEESPAQNGSAALDAGTVDEAVRKILEKLQPQLQELLSQGVLKPLVENMLQSELAKKDK